MLWFAVARMRLGRMARMALSNPQVIAVYDTAAKAIKATFRRFGARCDDDTLADLQQGTLVKVVSKYDADRGTAPGAMAWRVAVNEATDYLRGRSVGAIRNRDQSLTTEDDDGVESISDIADDSANPFDLLAARQLDAEITRGISNLPDGMKAGIRSFYASDDEAMSGADRIAKMRAVDALSESLSAAHFPVVGKGKKAPKVKAPKRAPKVAEEAAEVPGLAKLATQSRVEYELAHCLKAPLKIG